MFENIIQDAQLKINKIFKESLKNFKCGKTAKGGEEHVNVHKIKRLHGVYIDKKKKNNQNMVDTEGEIT